MLNEKDRIERDLADMGMKVDLDEDMGGKNVKNEIETYFLKEYGTKTPTKEQITEKGYNSYGSRHIIKTLIDVFGSLYLLLYSFFGLLAFIALLYVSFVRPLPSTQVILIPTLFLALMTVHLKKKLNKLDFGKSAWFSYFIVAWLFWNMSLLYLSPDKELDGAIKGIFNFMHGENGLMGGIILRFVTLLILLVPYVFIDELRIKQKSQSRRRILDFFSLIAFAVALYLTYLGYTKETMEQLNFIWSVLVGSLFFLCVKFLFLEKSNRIFETLLCSMVRRPSSKYNTRS